VLFRSRTCLHQTAVFVEEELGSHFQPLISFVRTTEADVHAIALSSGRGGGAGAGAGASGASGGGARATESKLPEGIVPRVDHAVADTLARDFTRTWKQAMAAINSSVSRYFANPRDAMEILKQVLTQLLMYYTRFQEIIKRCFADSPLERSLVRVQEIFAEIKVYSRTVE